ncbi:MAG: hypothetical protein Q8K36_04425 [Alphaproteobacteria bacterium]|nr:hypothetical protein [Alphaproteobacteria bacterium]
MTLCVLSHRSVITIKWENRFSFIQGLITQDIERLETKPIVYSLLLSAQGKFQYDLFLWDDDGILYIDTDRPSDLVQLLKRYALRRDLDICISDLKVYAAIGDTTPDRDHFQKTPFVFDDPRHNQMGKRLYTNQDLNVTGKLADYDAHRLMYGVIDGSRDMTIDRSIPLEWNMDQLHAISWDKGCYMGQELTSRTKHLGLIKKRIQVFDDQAFKIAASNPTVKHVKSYGQQHLCFVRLDEDESNI